MLHFEVLMIAGLLVCATMLRRRKVVEGLWILFWVHMALASVRHVPIFVAVACPLIAAELSLWWTAFTADSKKSSVAGILNQMALERAGAFRRTSLLSFAAVAVLILMGEPMRWPKDFSDKSFPVKIVHENLALIARSRVLTTDQWGDYLIFTNPRQKVYIDGRSDFYGEDVGNEYIRLLNGEWQWREVMAQRDFDLVLLPISNAIVQLLKQEPNWRVMADDGKQILLVRI
jgi:hypothetical protein